MNRLAPISTSALEAMRAERQARVAAILAELRDIELELNRRCDLSKLHPKLRLVELAPEQKTG